MHHPKIPKEHMQRLRAAIRIHLVRHGPLKKGAKSELARLYGVSRQRIYQIVAEEKLAIKREQREHESPSVAAIQRS